MQETGQAPSLPIIFWNPQVIYDLGALLDSVQQHEDQNT